MLDPLDPEKVLKAALETLRELHRKAPDAVILAADLRRPENREGADRIDPRGVEELLAGATRTGTIPLFFTTIPKRKLMDDEADTAFIENMPAGHFGVVLMTDQIYRVYLTEQD